MTTARVRKLSFAFAACLMASCLMQFGVAALSPSEIVSETAVLMDAGTGQVLCDKGMHKKMYPASITKIMTALLVLESCKPEEAVTVSGEAVFYDNDVAHIALCDGEEITVSEALYALMLPSANDAANALAEHVAGSQEAFVRMMNEKALQIGAMNTHFANPHGLHDKNHYTTAYDMALITRFAMGVPGFMEYIGTQKYVMPSNNLQLEERPFVNGDNMLLPWKGEYDKRVLGGKVGYTDEARHTMSTVAAEGGRTLICVVMNSPYAEYKYSDAKKLLKYGFEDFSPYTFSKESFPALTVPVGSMESPTGSVDFRYDRDLTVLLPDDIQSEDIHICYDPLPAFACEEDAVCSIFLILKEGEDGLPTVLMEVPMVGTFTPVPTPLEELAAVKEPTETEAVPVYAAAAQDTDLQQIPESYNYVSVLLMIGASILIPFATLLLYRAQLKPYHLKKTVTEMILAIQKDHRIR